ncbi:MAG: peptide ABC transporter substrate-binding protein [Clostridiales bacterium]|nr:peptide ABC transporter substrate-binding protein [Clostridiales bacterium]
MRRIYLLIILIMVPGTMIIGCNNEMFQLPNLEIDDGDKDETLDIIRNEEDKLIMSVTRFKTLNPLLNNNRSLMQVHRLLYESLVSFDEEMNITPQIAEKWEISEDGKSIEFTINSDIYWHDGEKFSVDDIVFTFGIIEKMYKDKKIHSPYENIFDVVSRVSIDDNTVTVRLKEQFGNALELMTFPILPSHLFLDGNMDKLHSNDFPLVGTGMYKLEDYSRMRRFTLVKNDRYWGQLPNIEKIEVRVVPDMSAQISLLDSADINFAQLVDTDWRRYYESENLRVHEFITNNIEFLGFNFLNEKLNSLNVRKAISYAIDRHRLISRVHSGYATIVDIPVNPNSWLYYEGAYKFAHDFEVAGMLLDEAGYRINIDTGIRESVQGEELVFRLITNEGNPTRKKTAYHIKEMLEEVGIKLEIEILEWERFNESISLSDFDLILVGWQLSEIHDLLFAFHSSEIENTNIINYQSEELDNKLENVTNSIEREEFRKNSQLVQKYLSDNLLYFCLFFEHQAIVMDSRVEGLINPQFHNIFYGIEEWYFTTD